MTQNWDNFRSLSKWIKTQHTSGFNLITEKSQVTDIRKESHQKLNVLPVVHVHQIFINFSTTFQTTYSVILM